MGELRDAPESTGSYEYRFSDFPSEGRPTGVQYTPEYDPDWVYPTGARAGGTGDNVPVQGLELGIVAREATLAATVAATLRGLESYHAWAGTYPRHRVVVDAAPFREQAEGGVGLVATVQPRPVDHDGLTDQFRALDEHPETDLLVAPNYEHALRVAVHLAGALAARAPRRPTPGRRGSSDRSRTRRSVSGTPRSVPAVSTTRRTGLSTSRTPTQSRRRSSPSGRRTWISTADRCWRRRPGS